jgi:hypothetical protein
MARFEEISWRLDDWDLLGTERPMPLMREVLPQLSRSQGRPPGAAPAGLPLDGGESEGIRVYLLMLWPSACECSCPWLRVDDGLISCAKDTDSQFGSIADRCDTSRPSCSASWPLSFV